MSIKRYAFKLQIASEKPVKRYEVFFNRRLVFWRVRLSLIIENGDTYARRFLGI
jgi:hypothetical protein